MRPTFELLAELEPITADKVVVEWVRL